MSLRFATPLCLPLLLLSTAALSAEKVLDRTFEVAPGGRLTVVADGSDITVRGTDSNRVVVHIVARGSEGSLESLQLSAEQTAEGVAVRAEHGRDGWRQWLSFNWNRDSQITVEVPHRYDVELKTSGGNIALTHLEGQSDGKTSGGDIRVADVQGPVRMKTSGGDVEAQKIVGDTTLNTSGGSIVVDSVQGRLEVHTSGGGIRVRSVTGPTIAHTSSGNVLAEAMQGDVDLETSGGDIKGLGLDGKIRAHTSGGDVNVALVGENRGIEATSSGGDITINVPTGVKGELDAATSGGSVKTDIPVTTTQTGEHKLRGTLNGGGPLIRARTSGGSVSVRAQVE